MEVLKRGAIFIVGRGLVLAVWEEPLHVKRSMRTHLPWHLDILCVTLTSQHTKGADVLGQLYNDAHVTYYVSR